MHSFVDRPPQLAFPVDGRRISSPAPNASFSISSNPVVVGTTLVTTHTGSNGAGSCTYQWNFGDPNNATNCTTENGVHVYKMPGIYTITLWMQDCNDSTSIQSTVILVTALVEDFDNWANNVITGEASGESVQWVTAGTGGTFRGSNVLVVSGNSGYINDAVPNNWLFAYAELDSPSPQVPSAVNQFWMTCDTKITSNSMVEFALYQGLGSPSAKVNVVFACNMNGSFTVQTPSKELGTGLIWSLNTCYVIVIQCLSASMSRFSIDGGKTWTQPYLNENNWTGPIKEMVITGYDTTAYFDNIGTSWPQVVPRALSAIPFNAQVNLAWTPPPYKATWPITDYKIYQGSAPGGESLLATIGNVTTYNSTGLTNGQVYYFKVAAVNAVGTGANATEISVMPGCPIAPQSLQATAGNMQVSLSWTAPAANGGSAISGYRIFQGTTSGNEMLVASTGNVTTFTITGLTNGQSYYFTVAAANSMGTGMNATEIKATPATVPTAPQALIAKPGNSEIILNWVAPASDGGSAVTVYAIYIGASPSNLYEVYSVYGTTTTHVTAASPIGDVGINNTQTYYLAVSAVNVMGQGPRSTVVNATPEAQPNAPVALHALGGNKSVALTWNAPICNGGSPITNYQISQGVTSNHETLLAMIGNVTTYTATNLTNGQPYYFTVAAMNIAGAGAYSTEANAMPGDFPGAPSTFLATPGSAFITLHWTSPASTGAYPITNYRIYKGMMTNVETVLTTVGNVSWFNATGLTNGQVYYFKVAAVNAMGSGVNSTELSVTPMASTNASFIVNNNPIPVNFALVTTHVGSNGVGSCMYQWNFGDATNVTNCTTENGMHVYATTGIYTVTLWMRDGSGSTSKQSTTVLVACIVEDFNNWANRQGITGKARDEHVYWSSQGNGAVLTYQGSNTTISSGNSGWLYPWDSSQWINVFGKFDTPSLQVPNASNQYWVSFDMQVLWGNAPQIILSQGNGFSAPQNVILQNTGSLSLNTKYTIVMQCLSNSMSRFSLDGGKTWTAAYSNPSSWTAPISGILLKDDNLNEILIDNIAMSWLASSVPTAPRSFTATGGNKQVTLNWTAPASNGGSAIMGYRIYRGTTPSGETLLTTTGVVLSYTVTNLVNGQVNYFKVAAVNAVGAGINSTEVNATPATSALSISSFAYITGNGTYVAGMYFVVRVNFFNPGGMGVNSIRAALAFGGYTGLTPNASNSITVGAGGTGNIDFLIMASSSAISGVVTINATWSGVEQTTGTPVNGGPSTLNVTIKSQAALAITSFTVVAGNGTYVAGMSFVTRVVLSNPVTSAKAWVTASLTFGGATGISANGSVSRSINGTGHIDFLITVTTGAPTQPTVTITTTVTGSEEISGRSLGPLTSPLVIAIKAQAALAITSIAYQSGNGTYVAGQTFVVRVSLSNPATSANALAVTAPLSIGGATGISANASASKTVSGTVTIDFLITITAGASSQPTVMITTTVTGTEEISSRALGPLTSTLGISIKLQAALAISTPTWQTGNSTYVAGMTFVVRVPLTNNPATNARALGVTASLSGLAGGVTANASNSRTILGNGYIDFLITIPAGTASESLSITASVSGSEEITARALSAGPSSAMSVSILAQAALAITNITYRSGNGTYVAGQAFIVRVALNKPVTSAEAFYVSTMLTYGGYTGISTNTSASKTIRGDGFIDLLVIIQANAMTATVSISASATGVECFSGRQLVTGPSSPLIVNIKSQATIIVDTVNLNTTATAPGRWLLVTVNVRNTGGIAVSLGNVSLTFNGNGTSYIQHPGNVVNWTLNSLYVPANNFINAQIRFFISSLAVNLSIIWVNASFTGTELISSRPISVPQANTPAKVTVCQIPGVIFSTSIVGGRTSYIRLPSSFDTFVIRAIIDNSAGTTNITGGAVSLNTISGFIVNTTYSSLVVNTGEIQTCDFLVTITNSASLGVSNFLAIFTGVNPSPFVKNSTPMSIMVCRPSNVVLTAITYLTGNGTYVGGQTFVVRMTFTNLVAGAACLGASGILNYGGSGLSANCSSIIIISANATTSIDFLISVAEGVPSQPSVIISATWTGTEQYSNRALSGSSGTNLVITIKSQAVLAIGIPMWQTGNGTIGYVAGMTFVVRVSLSNPAYSAKALTVTASLNFGGATGLSTNTSASKTISGIGHIDFLVTISSNAPSQAVSITATVTGIEEITSRALSAGPSAALNVNVKAQATLAITSITYLSGNGTYVAGQTFIVRVALSNPVTSAKALGVTASLSFGVATGISANASASKRVNGTADIDCVITLTTGAPTQPTVTITTTVTGTEEISSRSLGPLTSNLVITIKAQAALALTNIAYQSGNGTYVAGQTFVVRVALNNPATSARAVAVTAPLTFGGATGISANSSASKTIGAAGHIDFLVTIAPGAPTQTAVTITTTVTGTEEISGRALGPFTNNLVIVFKAQANLTIIGSLIDRTGNGTHVAGTAFVVRVSVNNPATSTKAIMVTASLNCIGAVSLSINASASKTISGAGCIDFLVMTAPGAPSQEATIIATLSGFEQITMRALSAGPSSVLNVNVIMNSNYTIPPTTSISISPVYTIGSKHWVYTATTFTLISSGGSGFQVTYYKWSGSGNHAWTRYTAPFTLTGMGNGTYTISWCSWDNANDNETLKTQVVYYDTFSPTTGIAYTASRAPNFVNETTMFSLTTSDNTGGSGVAFTQYQYSGSGGWQTYSSPFTLSSACNGTVVINYRGTDNVGNVESFGTTIVQYEHGAVPGAPQSFSATAGNGQVMLNWAAPASNGGSPIIAYQIFQGTTSNGETWLANTTGLTYTSTGLTNGQTYYYKVAAVNACGKGANSTEASATCSANSPPIFVVTPSNKQILNGTSTWLGWFVVDNTTSSSIYIINRNGTFMTWGNWTSGTNITYNTGVLFTGNYLYNITVWDGIGLSVCNVVIVQVLPTPIGLPSEPRSVTAVPGNAQVVLNWVAPASDGGAQVMSYWIYRWTVSSFPTAIITPGNRTAYTDTGLINGVTYFYKIAAENSFGTSANSTIVNATPSAAPLPRYSVLVLVFALHRQAFYNPITVAINITYGDWPVQQAWCIIDNSTVHILALSNGTATWGIYAVDVNLTAGSHVLAFFVQDTGNHTISKSVTITVLVITTTSNNSTIIVIIIVVFILGMSVGVAIPLSYSRYKQKLVQKKQLGLQANPKAKHISSAEFTPHPEAGKRESLSKASMPVTATAQPYLGVKVVQRCTLHKGLIVGPIYSCKACGAMYCIDCINQLRETGENCWNCGGSIEPENIEDRRQQSSVKQNLDSFQFPNTELTMFSTAVWEKLGDMEENRVIEPEIFEELIAKLKRIPPEDRLKYLDSEKFQVKQPHLDDEDE